MVAVLPAPFTVRKDGPAQTDAHVDGVLGARKKKKRKPFTPEMIVVEKADPYHKPKGPGGGQFTTADGTGGGSGDKGKGKGKKESSPSPVLSGKLVAAQSTLTVNAAHAHVGSTYQIGDKNVTITGAKVLEYGDVQITGTSVPAIANPKPEDWKKAYGPNLEGGYVPQPWVKMYADGDGEFFQVGNENEARAAAQRVTKSVHETGGTDWDGTKIDPSDHNGGAEVSTKISINKRIVARLSREMATDIGLQNWADLYVAKMHLDDPKLAQQTWQGLVGSQVDEKKYETAMTAWKGDVEKWARDPKVLKAAPGIDSSTKVINVEDLKVGDQLSNGGKVSHLKTDNSGKITAKTGDYTEAYFYSGGKVVINSSGVVPMSTTALYNFADNVAFVQRLDPPLTGAGLDALKPSAASSMQYLSGTGQNGIEKGMDIANSLPLAPLRPERADFAPPLPDVRVIALANKTRATIDSWAGSSGDTSPVSIALQRAVADTFGIDAAHQKPLKDFSDKSPYAMDTSQELQPYVATGAKYKKLEELAVGDKIFDGETVTKITTRNLANDDKGYIVSTVEANGKVHDGSYTFVASQAKSIAIDTRGPDDHTPTNTAWKIAGRMLDAERPFYSHFVQAVYEDTQSELKKHKATSLLLYRGMHLDDDATHPHAWAYPKMKSYEKNHGWTSAHAEDERITAYYDTATPTTSEITMQPLSSWSSNSGTAEGFSDNGSSGRGILLTSVVPASRVFSLAASSGVGCLNEREVVVLGGPGEARITWPNEGGWAENTFDAEEWKQQDSSGAKDVTVAEDATHPRLDTPNTIGASATSSKYTKDLQYGDIIDPGGNYLAKVIDLKGLDKGTYEVTYQWAEHGEVKEKTEIYGKDGIFGITPGSHGAVQDAIDAAQAKSLVTKPIAEVLNPTPESSPYPLMSGVTVDGFHYDTPKGDVALHVGDHIIDKEVASLSATVITQIYGDGSVDIDWAQGGGKDHWDYHTIKNVLGLPYKQIQAPWIEKAAPRKGGIPNVDAPLINADWIKYSSRDVSLDGTPITPEVQKLRAVNLLLPLAKVAHDISGEARDPHGEWTTGGDSNAQSGATHHFPEISLADYSPSGHGRGVTSAEFQSLANEGQSRLNSFAANSSPHKLTPSYAAPAYKAASTSWGGITFDAHTGKEIPQGAERYAVTTKPANMKTIEIPENASEAQFSKVFAHALNAFSTELNKQNACIGIFHDDDKHTIDLDPSTVVDSIHDVETIGAATRAVGGAYCFKDGNGYWPPHVALAPVIPLHKPTTPKSGRIFEGIEKGKRVKSQAQWRSENRSPDEEVESWTLENIDALDDDDFTTFGASKLIPIMPLKKAGPSDEARDAKGQWCEGTGKRPAEGDMVVAPVRRMQSGGYNNGSGFCPSCQRLASVDQSGAVMRHKADDPKRHTKASLRITDEVNAARMADYQALSSTGKSFEEMHAERKKLDKEVHAEIKRRIKEEGVEKAAHDVSGEKRITSGPGGGEWTIGGSNPNSPKAGPIHLPIPLAIPTMRGNAKVHKIDVDNFLQTSDGTPLRFSAHDITKLGRVREGVDAPKTAIKQAAEFDSTVRNKLMPQLVGPENLAEHGVDSFDTHLKTIAKSAVARYTADPKLIERDQFYSQWENSTRQLAEETQIPQDRVAAAMANLSAGTRAARNLRYGTDLARMVAMDNGRGFPLEDGTEAIAFLKHSIALTYLDTKGEPKPQTKAGADMEHKLNFAIHLIKSGQAQTLNDLPSDAAARVAHLYRQVHGPQGDILFDPRMGKEFHDLKEGAHAGFGVSKGYLNYAKATNVLRGYDIVEGADGNPQRISFTPSDAVQQVKTRNFLNNIIDPDDAQQTDSTTVDYHAMNSATFSIGGADGTGSSQWNSGATVGGVQLGIRAHVADSIRAQVPYLQKSLGVKHLSAARAQEILWAEWQRGLDRGQSPFDPAGAIPPTWTPFGGKPRPVLDLRTEKDALKEAATRAKAAKGKLKFDDEDDGGDE